MWPLAQHRLAPALLVLPLCLHVASPTELVVLKTAAGILGRGALSLVVPMHCVLLIPTADGVLGDSVGIHYRMTRGAAHEVTRGAVQLGSARWVAVIVEVIGGVSAVTVPTTWPPVLLVEIARRGGTCPSIPATSFSFVAIIVFFNFFFILASVTPICNAKNQLKFWL